MDDKNNKIEFPSNAYMQVKDFALGTHIDNLIATYGLDLMIQVTAYLVRIRELREQDETKAS